MSEALGLGLGGLGVRVYSVGWGWRFGKGSLRAETPLCAQRSRQLRQPAQSCLPIG